MLQRRPRTNLKMFVFADCRLSCEDRGYYFVQYECEGEKEIYHYMRLDDGASVVLKGVEWSSEVQAQASDGRAQTFDSVASFDKWLR